jgi:hypothetical protein
MPPNADVVIYLFSDPVRVGNARSDATGNFAAPIAVPPTTPPGVHTLVASSGSVNLSYSVVITATAAIPETR